MLTQEEKIKICSQCMNRKMSLKRGIVCKLTGEKPLFDESCNEYDADDRTIMLEEQREGDFSEKIEDEGFHERGTAADSDAPFSFNGRIGRIRYLWITLIANGFCSLIAGFLEFVPIVNILVAVFFTYIVLAAGAKRCHDFSRSGWWQLVPFYWLWMLFKKGDEGVNEYGNDPRMQSGEGINNKRKGDVIFVVIIVVSFLGGLAKGIVSSNTNTSSIEQFLLSTNANLPMQIEDGLVANSIEVDGNHIVYNMLCEDVGNDTGSDIEFDEYYAFAYKYEALSNLRNGKVHGATQLFHFMQEMNYDLRYVFRDKDDRYLFTIDITSEDMSRVLNTFGYICPISEFQTFIDSYERYLPCDYMGDATLKNICIVDNDSVLNYDIYLPRMSSYDLSKLTYSYLRDYIEESWWDLYDYTMQIAVLNQMPISFTFYSHSGAKHETVRIDYNMYKGFI